MGYVVNPLIIIENLDSHDQINKVFSLIYHLFSR